MSIANIKTTFVHMDTDQFIELPKYEHQRKEGPRMKKDHMKGDLRSATQMIVAATMIDNRLSKIDGHSRALAWKLGQLEKPATVGVVIYHVESEDQINALYDAFTSKASAATAGEEMFSLRSRMEFTPKSKLCKASWKSAYDILDSLPLEEAMNKYLPQLSLIDEWGINPVMTEKKKYSVPVKAAMLSTVQDNPEMAAEFWSIFRDDENQISAEVNDLRRLINSVDGSSGGVITRIFNNASGGFRTFCRKREA